MQRLIYGTKLHMANACFIDSIKLNIPIDDTREFMFCTGGCRIRISVFAKHR